MSEQDESTEPQHGLGSVPRAALWPSVELPVGYRQLTPPELPLPLFAILPERVKQRRWTVLLRAILAIPLAVAVLFVGLAAEVCVVLGWLWALVMGRAPGFVRAIVTVFLRMLSRLEAYLFLLTDRFPPLGGEDVPEYHVRLAVPPATRLNRAAVLFRLVLVIPASIALRVVGLGLYIVTFFMWFVVLVTGWLPRPVHGAAEAFIRYEIRLIGYFDLLVPTYPGELFGDLALPVAALVPIADLSGSCVVKPTRAPPPVPQPWMLFLTTGAKRLLLVTVVLGVVAIIGLNVLNVSLENHDNLVSVNNELVSSINHFTSTADDCQSVSCLEQADGELSGQLGSFVSAIEGANRAGVSQELVTQVTTAAQQAQRVTAALAQAGPTLSDYRSAAARLDASQTLNALITAQHRFVTAVNASKLG
jgi:Domain of unknown function (DUF4389)